MSDHSVNGMHWGARWDPAPELSLHPVAVGGAGVTPASQPSESGADEKDRFAGTGTGGLDAGWKEGSQCAGEVWSGERFGLTCKCSRGRGR